MPCSPLAAEALCSCVAQQEGKVEVKDHLRAGDLESLLLYSKQTRLVARMSG
jgi:hypothetical protein